MKKISIVLMAAAVMFASSSASAQKLSNLLKSVASSDVVNSVVNAYVPGANSVSLPGSWTYTGCAISLTSDNVLSNVAGSAVTSGVEKKADDYLQKIGIKSGSLSFTFNEDKTFTCKVFGINLSGTWQLKDDASKVQLQYGKLMKYLSMTGTLSKTTDGCEILFDADKFLSFVKTALSFAGKSSSTTSSSTSGLSSLTSSYKGMKMGYKLAKQ